MRDILFRGKSFEDSQWIDGIYVEFEKGFSYIMKNFHDVVKVFPETVGQYTGLTDIEDKKIFEGDIMETCVTGLHHHVGVVEFSDGAFGLRCTNGDAFFLCFVAGSYKIIGNIHDDPELLREVEHG